MRKVPDRWGMVVVGDILTHEPTERVFRVEDMTYEHGYYTRITVYVLNLMTRVTTMWVVAADQQLDELTWIGEGG
jgi:hypothetical protein